MAISMESQLQSIFEDVVVCLPFHFSKKLACKMLLMRDTVMVPCY